MAVGAWAIEPAPEPHPSSEEGEPHPVWQELLQDGVIVEQESEALHGEVDRLREVAESKDAECADLKAKDQYQRTLEDVARERGHDALLDYLERGAEPEWWV